MDKYKKYKYYKELINNLLIKRLFSINWGSVLSFHIWETIDKKYIDMIFLSLKKSVKVCFFDEFITKTSVNNNPILFVYVDRGRKDYDDMYNKVKKCVSSYDETIIHIKRKFNLKKFTNIKVIAKNYRELRDINKVFYRLYYASLIVFYNEIGQKIISEAAEQYKLVVTFCDAHPYENIVAQIYSKMKVKTATLQHGAYFFNNSTVDCIHYESFVSDYLLAWGSFTTNEFKKAAINSERILEVGHPKYIGFDFPKTPYCNSNRKKIFGVILGGTAHIERNKKLIYFANRLSEKCSYEYIVRVHPSDSIERYREEMGTFFNRDIIMPIDISEYAKLIDFSIIHTSSVYFELIALLSPVFVLNDGENFFENKKFKDLYFANQKELIALVKQFHLRRNEVVSLFKENREYFFQVDSSKEKYQVFFKQFY